MKSVFGLSCFHHYSSVSDHSPVSAANMSCVFLFVSTPLQELKDYPVYPDPSLKAFEGATLRYASLKLKYTLIPHLTV